MQQALILSSCVVSYPKAVIVDLRSCNGIMHSNTADPIPCFLNSRKITVEKYCVCKLRDSPVDLGAA